MNKIHVFIDGIGTSTAQNVVKDIADFYQKSVTITGFDMTVEQPGKFLCDNFHILPSARSEDYAKKLASYFEKYINEDPTSFKVYIPIIDYGFLKNFSVDLSYIYNNKVLLSNKVSFFKQNSEVEQHIFLASAGYNTLQCYMNKLTMYEFFNFFSSKGIKVPFKLPKSSGEWFVSDYPLIVKPRNFGRASIGVKECKSKAETVAHCEFLKQDLYLPIVQEKIEGVEITVDCLCDLQGNYISSLARERIDVKSGVSQKARIFKDDGLVECAKFIANTSDFKGPFNAQFILNSKGYHLIEINPRFSGGLNLSNSAGFHSPCALLNMISDYFERSTSDLNIIKLKYLLYKEGKAYKTSTAVFDDGY